jgi:hypothetical protein
MLGMLGQVAYHLLNASHAARAPWPVVVLVSSLPVIVLGFGAALSHLLRGESGEPANALEVNPETVLAERPETIPTVPESAPEPVTAEPVTSTPASTRPTAAESTARTARRAARKAPVRKIKAPVPADFYAADLAAGRLPSIRQVKADLHVGEDRAKAIHGELAALLVERVPVAA